MSENTINIYMGAEDKVNVKDATQIIKLQGPKGEPGPKGEDGVQGPKGEPLRFEELTEAQKLELKGDKGDKGELILHRNSLTHSKALKVILGKTENKAIRASRLSTLTLLKSS